MEKKILVIDDDLFIREIYVDVLQQAGYNVDSAPDGIEGIRKLKSGGYTLVFLDLMMPKIDGLEVLSTIAANPPAIKNGQIVLLSNSSSEEQIKIGLDIGASAYLIKVELTPDKLLEYVKQHLATI